MVCGNVCIGGPFRFRIGFRGKRGGSGFRFEVGVGGPCFRVKIRFRFGGSGVRIQVRKRFRKQIRFRVQSFCQQIRSGFGGPVRVGVGLSFRYGVCH